MPPKGKKKQNQPANDNLKQGTLSFGVKPSSSPKDLDKVKNQEAEIKIIPNVNKIECEEEKKSLEDEVKRSKGSTKKRSRKIFEEEEERINGSTEDHREEHKEEHIINKRCKKVELTLDNEKTEEIKSLKPLKPLEPPNSKRDFPPVPPPEEYKTLKTGFKYISIPLPKEEQIPKNKSPMSLNSSKYDPIKDAPFEFGESVPLSFITDGLALVEDCKGENSVLQIKKIVSNMHRSISILKPEEWLDMVYFLIMKLAPEYEGKETGVGKELVLKAVAIATGRTDRQVKESLNVVGDIGKVLAQGKGTTRTMDAFFAKKHKKQLMLNHVMETFKKIAATKGNNSVNEKLKLMNSLLFDSTNEESKYIARWLYGSLKLGAAEKTFISALARAICLTPPNQKYPPRLLNQESTHPIIFESKVQVAEECILRAITEHPNYENVLDALLTTGDDFSELEKYCHITPGIPVKPMLAKPTKGVNIILKRFEGIKFTCEYKYDGLRGQIHYSNSGEVGIFSRNLENMTGMYPDVVEFVRNNVPAGIENFILDSEIVAYDPQQEKILPFQNLSTRSRKGVKLEDVEVSVCIFAFDLIYMNDKSLLSDTLESRRELLHTNFPEVPHKLHYAKHINSQSVEEIEEFLEESVRGSCEGLMVKTLIDNSTYQPSKRSLNWLKLKKDYIDTQLGDSFDLVVVGAKYGIGKRTGVYGAFLLASYDEDTDNYKTVCKIGTGFSDEELKNTYSKLSGCAIQRPPSGLIIKEESMDVYFAPEFVWEMKAADLSISPIYMAGVGDVDPNRGIGLRFPRFLRWREDKKAEDCTNCGQIVKMYMEQPVVNMDCMNEDD